MHMARQMSRIEPKVRIHGRGTPIGLIVPRDIGLVIPATKVRRVDDAILRRMIHHISQHSVGIVHHDAGARVGLRKAVRMLLQGSVEPRDLGGVGAWDGGLLVALGAVERGQVHEEVGAVAEGVQLAHGVEERGDQVVVEG